MLNCLTSGNYDLTPTETQFYADGNINTLNDINWKTKTFTWKYTCTYYTRTQHTL